MELLRRYVFERSETAFAELVRQHVGLVYSAALRQTNGDAHLAEDITQEVFTDLARKAPRLVRHSSLAGWLYTSTRYAAATFRRAELRRRAREQEAHAMNQILQSAGTDPAWEQLRPILDEAMHELKATDREAVLLRFFERLPLAEVGERLGVSENTARMRISRALERLRGAVADRGATSTAGALELALGSQVAVAVPAHLAGSVSAAALAAAGATSVLAAALARLLISTKVKLLVGSAAAIAVTAVLLWQFAGTKPGAAGTFSREDVVMPEPRLNGKSISWYLARMNAPDDGTQTSEKRFQDYQANAAVLRQMGPPAVAWLAQRLEQKESAWQAWYRNAWNSTPPLARRFLSAPSGPPGAGYPAKDFLRRGELRALCEIGGGAVAVLTNYLDSSRYLFETRLQVYNALLTMDHRRSGVVALPMLEHNLALRGPDTLHAAYAIAVIDPQRTDQMVSLLRTGLADGFTRSAAVMYLWNLGKAAQAAAPDLEAALDDPDPAFRERVRTALQRVTGKHIPRR